MLVHAGGLVVAADPPAPVAALCKVAHRIAAPPPVPPEPVRLPPGLLEQAADSDAIDTMKLIRDLFTSLQ